MSTPAIDEVGVRVAVADGFDPRLDVVQDVVYAYARAGSVQGIGESQSTPELVRAVIEAPASRTLARSVRDVVVGRSATEVAGLMVELRDATTIVGTCGVVVHALSALEQALYDLRGKLQSAPVWRILSPQLDPGPGPAIYITVWAPATAEEMDRLAARVHGLRVAGIKVAYPHTGVPGGDERIFLQSLRAALGPELQMMIDLQSRTDPATLPTRLESFAEAEMVWLEEPFSTVRLDLYEQLAAISPVPIAAGERETTLAGFRRLMDAGVTVLQPDIGRCGGIGTACQVATMARQAGGRAVTHGWGTGVNLAANVHWAVATQSELIEYCGATSPLDDDLVRGAPSPVDGRMAVPDAPGLGVSLRSECGASGETSPGDTAAQTSQSILETT